jgi:hypothetical protein
MVALAWNITVRVTYPRKTNFANHGLLQRGSFYGVALDKAMAFVSPGTRDTEPSPKILFQVIFTILHTSPYRYYGISGGLGLFFSLCACFGGSVGRSGAAVGSQLPFLTSDSGVFLLSRTAALSLPFHQLCQWGKMKIKMI